jgi:hypothetical protein
MRTIAADPAGRIGGGYAPVQQSKAAAQTDIRLRG